jgi:hypothetical protein
VSSTPLSAALPKPTPEDGLPSLKAPSVGSALDDAERKVDEIEMIGEELAAELPVSPAKDGVTAGMRYLHSSRTIHQLVTDRNRAVGLYLGVATLLWTASTALLNVRSSVNLVVPIEVLQKWCLPVTLGVMTLLSLFTAFLLIRTRIGLIYEVAKMNALLGLPSGRVQRVNMLSLFFIMHAFICLAGGGSGWLFLYHVFHYAEVANAALYSTIGGIVIALGLMGLYIGTVLYTTTDQKLQGLAR